MNEDFFLHEYTDEDDDMWSEASNIGAYQIRI